MSLPVNVDMSAFVAAQVLSQLDDAAKEKLLQDAIASVLKPETIEKILREEAINIARIEVKELIQGDTEVRARLAGLINGAFEKMLSNEEELKGKLCNGLITALVKDRY